MNGQRVGVVGDEQLAEAVESAGGTAVVDEASALDTVELILVIDEKSVVDLARASIDVPTLLVDFADGLPSIPVDRLDAAFARIFDGRAETQRHPLVAVSGSFGSVRAVFDVALMAAEPARISEFSVTGAEGRISRFRADGVVASTPAGSHGYNRRAGGPIVAAGTGVASVVPIAPFSMSAGRWVLPIESIELAVERDETPVELLVDGRREQVIDPKDTLSLSIPGALETYVFSDLDDPVRDGDGPLDDADGSPRDRSLFTG